MTAAMAWVSPVGVSETTCCTPLSPRALSERRNAVQNAPSSESPTSSPRTSRPPSAVTPVAVTTARETTRPSTLALRSGASTTRYGKLVWPASGTGTPRPRGRARRRSGRPPTWKSHCQPQGLDQVVELGGGGAVPIGLHHHCQQGSVNAAGWRQQRREERALPQLGDAQLQLAGLGRQQPGAGAIAVGGAGLGALIAAGTDGLVGLGVDQRLQHQPSASRTTSRSPPARGASSSSDRADLLRAIVANSLVCTLAGTH
jgi:hypothetical protein